jgi:hypothetical protein
MTVMLSSFFQKFLNFENSKVFNKINDTGERICIFDLKNDLLLIANIFSENRGNLILQTIIVRNLSFVFNTKSRSE